MLDVLRNLPRLSLSSGKGLSPEQLQSFEREHLRSLLSLGEIFKVQHKMKYAEPIFLEAYVGCRESLGPTHFDTLSSLQERRDHFLCSEMCFGKLQRHAKA